MRLKVLRSGAGCSANYRKQPESSGGHLRPRATVVCGSGVQTPMDTRRGGKLCEAVNRVGHYQNRTPPSLSDLQPAAALDYFWKNN